MIFQCATCEEKFDDPCEDAGGESCGEHRTKLAAAGWTEVLIRLFAPRQRGKDVHLLTRGGWMCPKCGAEYSRKPARRRKRAA